MATSCTFKPDGENIVAVEPPEEIATTIEVNSPQFASVYYIFSPTYFTFTLEDNTKPVISYEVTVNGEVISSTFQNPTITFFLWPSSGTHRVVITVKLATNSGSLADKLDAEYYLIEKVFTVVADPIPPTLGTPPTLALENGYLTCRWNPPSKYNFIYAIGRVYDPYFPLTAVMISNPQLNHFVDSGYVGGKITFKIQATGLGFEQHLMGQATFSDVPYPVNFTVAADEQRVVRLSWDQTLINTTGVMVDINYGNRRFPLTASNTIILDTLAIAESTGYFIKLERPQFPLQAYSRHLAIEAPLNMKQFKKYAMMPTHGKLLTLTPDKLYRYRLSDLTIEDSISVTDLGAGTFSSLAVSRNEASAALVAGPDNLFRFDPLNFSNITGVTIAGSVATNLGSHDITKLDLGTLSDNGLLGMVVYSFDRKWGTVFDLATGMLLWNSSYFLYLNPVRPPVLSVDGSRMVYDFPATGACKVYQWSGTEFTQVGTVTEGLKFFREGHNELISTSIIEPYILPPNPIITFYDLTPPSDPSQSLTVIRTFHPPGLIGEEYLHEMRYDDFTGTLYTRRLLYNITSYLRIHDINDFHELSKIEAMTYANQGHEIAGNYHLSTRGFIAPRP